MVIAVLFHQGRFSLKCGPDREPYGDTSQSSFIDYVQMSHLPWANPPVGIGALGETELSEVRKRFPRQSFDIGEVPESCPSKTCPGIRIYETGNTLGPNVAFGHI